MCVDVAHLVLEAFCDADDQVVDEGADGSEGSDILAVAVVDLDGDGVLLGLAKVDGQVTEILDELPYSSTTLLDVSLLIPSPMYRVSHLRVMSRCQKGEFGGGGSSYLGGPRR